MNFDRALMPWKKTFGLG